MGLLGRLQLPPLIKPYVPSDDINWRSKDLKMTPWLDFEDPDLVDEFRCFLHRDLVMIMTSSMYISGMFFFSQIGLTPNEGWNYSNYACGVVLLTVTTLDLILHFAKPSTPENPSWNTAKRNGWGRRILGFCMSIPISVTLTGSPYIAYQIKNCRIGVDYLELMHVRARPHYSSEEYQWYCPGIINPFEWSAMCIAFLPLPLPPHWVAVQYIIFWVLNALVRVGYNDLSPHHDPEPTEAKFGLGIAASILMFGLTVVRYRSGTVHFKQAVLVKKETAEAEMKEMELDGLLMAMLPPRVINRLGAGKTVSHFTNEATVLFSDMVSFTAWSSTRSAGAVVSMLNTLCVEFDAVAMQYEVEKVKTIGDAYWAVSGLPDVADDHAERICNFGNAMLEVVGRQNKKHREWGNITLRVGVHSGPLCGGVLGTRQLSYEVFGETSNLAEQAEQKGKPDRVVISEVTLKFLELPPEALGINSKAAVYNTLVIPPRPRRRKSPGKDGSPTKTAHWSPTKQPPASTSPKITNLTKTSTSGEYSSGQDSSSPASYTLFVLPRRPIAVLRNDYYANPADAGNLGSSNNSIDHLGTSGYFLRTESTGSESFAVVDDGDAQQEATGDSFRKSKDGSSGSLKGGRPPALLMVGPTSHGSGRLGSAEQARLESSPGMRGPRGRMSSLGNGVAGVIPPPPAGMKTPKNMLSPENGARGSKRKLPVRDTSRDYDSSDQDGSSQNSAESKRGEKEQRRQAKQAIAARKRRQDFLSKRADKRRERSVSRNASGTSLKNGLQNEQSMTALQSNASFGASASGQFAASVGNVSLTASGEFGPDHEDYDLEGEETLKSLEAKYSRRKYPAWYHPFDTFEDPLVEAEYFQFIRKRQLDLRKLSRIMMMLTPIMGFICILAEMDWQKQLPIYCYLLFLLAVFVAAADLVFCFVSRGDSDEKKKRLLSHRNRRGSGRKLKASTADDDIVMPELDSDDEVDGAAQSQQKDLPVKQSLKVQIPKLSTVATHVAGLSMILAAGLVPGGMSTATNDITYLHAWITTITGVGNVGLVSGISLVGANLLIFVPVCVILMEKVVYFSTQIVFLLMSNLCIMFVIMVMEKQYRRQFLQQHVAEFFREQQKQKNREREELLASVVPQHVVKELVAWMESDDLLGKTINHRYPGVCVAFVHLFKPSHLESPGVSRGGTPRIKHIGPRDAGGSPPPAQPDDGALMVMDVGSSPSLSTSPQTNLEKLEDSDMNRDSKSTNVVDIGEAGSAHSSDTEVLLDCAEEDDDLANQLNSEHWLQEIHTQVDSVLRRFFSIDKVKTIGDVVMIAGPFIVKYSTEHAADHLLAAVWHLKGICALRAGIHVGEVVGAVLGTERLCFDIFGDSVNTASRTMTSGIEGDISISEEFYSILPSKGSPSLGSSSLGSPGAPPRSDSNRTNIYPQQGSQHTVVTTSRSGEEGNPKTSIPSGGEGPQLGDQEGVEASLSLSELQQQMSDSTTVTKRSVTIAPELVNSGSTSIKRVGINRRWKTDGVVCTQDPIEVAAKGKGTIHIRRVLSLPALSNGEIADSTSFAEAPPPEWTEVGSKGGSGSGSSGQYSMTPPAIGFEAASFHVSASHASSSGSPPVSPKDVTKVTGVSAQSGESNDNSTVEEDLVGGSTPPPSNPLAGPQILAPPPQATEKECQ